MSEMNGRENYSRYDEMTTEELREILRMHAHGELEKEPDTEELFYIMEVLADRESENPEKQIQSTEEAYATFVKHYAPEMAKDEPIPFSIRGAVVSRWVKRVAVVVIVCVALTTVAVGTKAFAPNFWSKVACWTKEFFSFEDVNGGTAGQKPDKEVNIELNSLLEVLDQYEMSKELAPNWIPQGYVCVSANGKETPRALLISAVYEKDGEQLIIKIWKEFDSDSVQIEKNENLIEIYTADGVDYYIFSNDEALQTAWIVGEFECVIGGRITLEEMRRIIDSI